MGLKLNLKFFREFRAEHRDSPSTFRENTMMTMFLSRRDQKTGSTGPGSNRRVGVKTNSVRFSLPRLAAMLILLLAMIDMVVAGKTKASGFVPPPEQEVKRLDGLSKRKNPTHVQTINDWLARINPNTGSRVQKNWLKRLNKLKKKFQRR